MAAIFRNGFPVKRALAARSFRKLSLFCRNLCRQVEACWQAISPKNSCAHRPRHGPQRTWRGSAATEGIRNRNLPPRSRSADPEAAGGRPRRDDLLANRRSGSRAWSSTCPRLASSSAIQPIRASFPHATSAVSDDRGGSKTSPYFGRANSPPKMHAAEQPSEGLCRRAPTQRQRECTGCAAFFSLMLGFRHKGMAGQMPGFTSVNFVSALRDLCITSFENLVTLRGIRRGERARPAEPWVGLDQAGPCVHAGSGRCDHRRLGIKSGGFDHEGFF
jgi:hypothetical protein